MDASVIARFAMAIHPVQWSPPTPHEEEMLSILRHIETIKEMAQAEKNRLHALETIGPSTSGVQKTIKKHIAFLESQIAELSKRLKNLITEHPDIDTDVKLLCSIPGVGDITACNMLSEIGDVSRFESVKQLVAFAGIAPAERQSGTSVHGKTMINKRGSKRLRKTLYMPAMVAARHNPTIKIFYERLLSKGKKPICALVACMRKLLHIAYGVLKHRKAFDANWNKPLSA